MAMAWATVSEVPRMTAWRRGGGVEKATRMEKAMRMERRRRVRRSTT
jgi:hypothetical protein